jgi:transposase
MKTQHSIRCNPSAIADVKCRTLESFSNGECKVKMLARFFCIAFSTLYLWIRDFKQKGYIDTKPKKKAGKSVR